MDVSVMIPMIGQLLTLGFKLADLIDKAENVSDDDKEAMKAAITKAKEGVTYWDDTTKDGN